MTEQDVHEQTPQGSPSPEPTARGGQYQVFARKYRPTDFSGLIGQDALVRTLTNAIEQGRLAHGFILTGVRGIGKTTAARIIARALNCVGEDGTGGPTPHPCGVCDHCRAIAEDRHVDVLEMDAASRSKVEEMRELLDGVRYRPTSARFKVYIIDEIHMLSGHAFNALLKTLEEPPEHVKFIFATTETRKVPVTVLSRCQRFDLRRVDGETLAVHFAGILEKEGATAAGESLHLIARAADGSVRDGLSLLDQAVAHSGGKVTEEQVRDMLGLADRTVTFDLLDSVMKGDVATALSLLAHQYEAGADPAVVLEDMLELINWITRIKVVPQTAETPGVPEAERVRGRDMAGGLSMAAVTRAWQMLLKGLGEARVAPSSLQAAEMVLVRLAYAANLPTPADAIKTMAPDSGTPSTPPGPPPAPSSGSGAALAMAEPVPVPQPQTQPQPQPEPEPAKADPATFQEVVSLANTLREAVLGANLMGSLHLVSFEPGRIEFHPEENAPPDLANQLSRFLNANTARRWVVSVSERPGAPTLHQREKAKADAVIDEAKAHPLVKAVLETFPGAKVESVKDALSAEPPPEEEQQDA